MNKPLIQQLHGNAGNAGNVGKAGNIASAVIKVNKAGAYAKKPANLAMCGPEKTLQGGKAHVN